MKLRSGIVALPVSRRGLLVLLSVSAITVLVVVQFWEFLNWITIQQHLRGPEFNDIVDRNLDDRRADPSSRSRTKLDEELATKYNESCVKLGTGHMERSLRAPTRCFSRDEVRGILVNLTLSASAVFTEHNITHFLDSGTLLGSVRHKTIIPFDQDVDMGIDEAGYEKIKSTPILFPKQYAMHVHNSNIHPRGSRYKELPVRIVHRESTLYVDVFVYIDKLDEKDGKKTTGPLASGAFINCRMCRKIGKGGEKEFRVPYDWIYPLQLCRFAGYELRCPNKPNEYLQFMFGKNYMKPEVFPY